MRRARLLLILPGILMAGCGMKPAEVLAATTSSAAELLGVDHELGCIAPGLRGDLAIVTGDPYDFPGLSGNIREVWKDGICVFGAR